MDSYFKSLEKMASLIKSKEELKEIKIVEKEIFSNPEIIPYISAFNEAQEDFNFTITHFKNDEEKIEVARKKLVNAKKEMDSIPLIKKYNELYESIVKDTLYLEKGLKEILKNGDIKEC